MSRWWRKTPWGRQKGKTISFTNHGDTFFFKQRCIIILIGWARKGIDLFCVLVTFLLLWQNAITKAIYKAFNWAHGFRGLESIKGGAKACSRTAESSHLDPQAGGREQTVNGLWSFETSDLLPTTAHCHVTHFFQQGHNSYSFPCSLPTEVQILKRTNLWVLFSFKLPGSGGVGVHVCTCICASVYGGQMSTLVSFLRSHLPSYLRLVFHWLKACWFS